jgi:hypothetical protein
MIVYNELKKRNLIDNEKEFNYLIWMKQIKVNDKFLISSNDTFKKIEKIKIGISEILIK